MVVVVVGLSPITVLGCPPPDDLPRETESCDLSAGLGRGSLNVGA